MLKQLTFYALFACLFQGFLFLNRNDIIAEYKPLLTERVNNYSAEYAEAAAEYTLTLEEIKNQTWATVASMNTQIATLKQTIVTALNVSSDDDAVVACLTAQQTAANALSSVAINSTCWVGVSYPDLATARDALHLLATIPNGTIEACTSLNPLPSQDELFLDCITHKILDLDELNDVLTANFTTVKTETLDTSVGCLADQSTLVSEQINEIDFEVTLCMS
ncbi:uncharacterized protein LOC135135787 [Zophobas morio]|uniref:uncharacterized protein LOC135135787 n=1 Tax=Zophobas morio TaxID=2755281 RepID=UPI00308340BE